MRVRVRAAAAVLLLIVPLVGACSGAPGPSLTPTPGAPSPPSAPSSASPAAATPFPRPTMPPGLVIHGADASAGVPLGYVEYVPPGVAEPAPLLVFLHGSGESGPGTAASLTHLFAAAIPKLIRYGGWAADRPFIVLMPQHDETQAAPCFTPAEIDGFLHMALERYPVDPKRVYLTGLSCGAIGSWDYLGQHTNEVVAAAVLIAGDGRNAFDLAGCRLGLVPIWALHGTSDNNVDPTGSSEVIAELQACTKPKAVDARLTMYENAEHNVWDRTYTLSAGNDVYAWLLSHVKP